MKKRVNTRLRNLQLFSWIISAPWNCSPYILSSGNSSVVSTYTLRTTETTTGSPDALVSTSHQRCWWPLVTGGSGTVENRSPTYTVTVGSPLISPCVCVLHGGTGLWHNQYTSQKWKIKWELKVRRVWKRKTELDSCLLWIDKVRGKDKTSNPLLFIINR
jgi:hypothetical protein